MSKKNKKRAFYSLLLMRDDSPVRSLRIKHRTLQMLLFFLFLLVSTAVAGSMISYRYMDRFYALQKEHQLLEKNFVEARLELEQLTNVKSLVEKSEATTIQAKNEEIPSEEKVSDTSNKTATLNATALQKNASQIVTQGVSATTLNATTPKVDDPLSNIPLIESETSPIRISEFSWKNAGNQRIQIRYELSSQAGKQVAGSTLYYGMHKNGTLSQLEMRDRSNSRFAISRMKRMDATLILPASLPINDVVAIKTLIQLEDQNKYQWSYPFNQ